MAISEAEAVVMDVLWREAPRSAEEILAFVGPMQNWQEGTVKSLLNRLLRKKAVEAEREGRRYLYTPLLTREQYVLQESKGLLDRLFGGRVAPLVAHFSEQRKLSKKDIAELRKLLEELDEMRLESMDWLADCWQLLLAFSAGVVITALLRKPARRWFGAELAYRFWLLPPLAMLAGVLPHAAATPVVVLTPVMRAIALPMARTHAQVAYSGGVDWRVIVLLWLSGTVASLLLAAMAQWRYHLHLREATVVLTDQRFPVLRARVTDVGPAMVGAWQRRILIPADFEQRYSREEQALILAHEAIHARRFDGVACLLGRLLAALFWFHPLAWWALSAFRQDQELACDAAVLREHGMQRRLYADAMLKTRAVVGALPAGCSWAPRHPLMERIAMLKARQPGTLRRRLGWLVLVAAGTGLTVIAYAAAPAVQVPAAVDAGDFYTLKADVRMGGGADTTHFATCVKRGESVEFNGVSAPGQSWKGRFEMTPSAEGQVEIRAKITTQFDQQGGSAREQSAQPIVRTLPGRSATIVFGEVVKNPHEPSQDRTIKLVLTPSSGCIGGGRADAGKPTVSAAHEGNREYQLNTSVELTTDNGHSDHVRRATFAICAISGKQASFKVHDLMFDVEPVSTAGNHLQIQLKASDATHPLLAQATLNGALNGILHADGVSADGKSRYVMEVTPLSGCPARDKSAVQKASA